MNLLTASIVLYKNDPQMVTRVIESFFDGYIEEKGPRRLLYLIDNSPNDELKKLQTINPNNIVYKFLGDNVGYGRGHNVAIRKSIEQGAPYHVVLNPDIWFDATTIPNLLDFMESNHNVGCVAPKIKNEDGSLRYCCRLLPTPQHHIVRRFLPNFLKSSKKDDVYLMKHHDYSKVVYTPNASGCFMFLRNKALQEVGLFDENIFMYYEDTDLSRRVHQKYQLCCIPNASAVHWANRESYKSFTMLKVHIKSAIYYFNKWGWFFDKERREVNKKYTNI